MQTRELGKTAADNKVRFHFLKGSGLAPFIFGQPDHAGNALDLLDQIHIGELAVSCDQLAVSLKPFAG